MRLAHLIICHTAPEQVRRLVAALHHPDADVYIHVDKKVSIAPFLQIAELANVHFIQERERVHWGGYSIVQATLCGFREILRSGIPYDYINLLSGQDYPLTSPTAIHQYIADNKGSLLMNIFPEWNKNAEHEHRLKQYYFAGVNIRGKYTAERIARMVKPRVFPEGFLPIGRSQWFTIPLECATYIVKFIAENKKIVRLFKYMWAPDELLFQSILYNSPYRNAITNDHMRYVDWTERGPSPKILTMDDAKHLESSGNLFARKFDMRKDEAILDHLDKLITGR